MDQPLSPVFYIGTIRVGNIEGASCLNMGNNWPTNFTSHKKHNQGFGNVSGNENNLRSTRSLLNDPDTLDALNLRDDDLPEWLQTLTERLQGDSDEPVPADVDVDADVGSDAPAGTDAAEEGQDDENLLRQSGN